MLPDVVEGSGFGAFFEDTLVFLYSSNSAKLSGFTTRRKVPGLRNSAFFSRSSSLVRPENGGSRSS